jgi:hypothetical protein
MLAMDASIREIKIAEHSYATWKLQAYRDSAPEMTGDQRVMLRDLDAENREIPRNRARSSN